MCKYEKGKEKQGGRRGKQKELNEWEGNTSKRMRDKGRVRYKEWRVEWFQATTKSTQSLFKLNW